jgi:hypothetical protein
VNPPAVVALNFLIATESRYVSWELNPAAVVVLNFLIEYRKPLISCMGSESCSSNCFKVSNSVQKAAP